MRAHLARLHATYLVLTDPARATHPAGANPAAANPADPADHPEGGQATTEYALVLLGAALVALLVVAWATGGDGAGKIGRLFSKVIDSVTGRL